MNLRASDHIIFLMGLYILAYQDYRKKEVSLTVIMLLCFAGIIFRVTDSQTQWASVAAGIGIGGIILLLSILSRGKIGIGDGWILAVSGLYLEFWDCLNMCIFAIYLAGMSAFVLYVAKRCKRDDTLPFMPFLLAGYVILLWKNGG